MTGKRILCLALVLAALFSCFVLLAAAEAETGGVATTAAQLATPKITSVSGGAGSVKISWGAVSGAAKYRVFYKNGSSWKKIADTTATSYTWAGAAAGTSYTFTVRCVSADGSAFTSSYDTAGTSFTYLAAPKLVSLTKVATGIKVSWNPVSGAQKYRVFFKTNGGSWTEAGDTASTSYILSALSGIKYTFTVRCVSADGETYMSGYDATGLSLTYKVDTPAKFKATYNNGGIRLTWDSVAMAEYYLVVYRVGNYDPDATNWQQIEDGGWSYTTSMNLNGGTSGVTYTFVLVAVDSIGNISDYAHCTYTHP